MKRFVEGVALHAVSSVATFHRAAGLPSPTAAK